MKWLSLLCVFLLLSSAAEAKPFYKTKSFWIQTGIIVAANFADARTAQTMRDRCPACPYHSLVLSQHPSDSSLYWSHFGTAGAEVGGLILIRKAPAWVKWSYTGSFGFLHGQGAYFHSQVGNQTFPSGGGVRPCNFPNDHDKDCDD